VVGAGYLQISDIILPYCSEGQMKSEENFKWVCEVMFTKVGSENKLSNVW